MSLSPTSALAATSTPEMQTTNLNSEVKRALTAADRCDVCAAQALIRVVLNQGELLFCAHHGHAHMPALQKQALYIQDESEHLLAK